MKLFGRFAIPGVCVTPFCMSRRERHSKYPLCDEHGRQARYFDQMADPDYWTQMDMFKASMMLLVCPPESPDFAYWSAYHTALESRLGDHR